MSSESAVAFGLSPRYGEFPAKDTKEDIAEMVERVLDQMRLSTYEKPFALVNDDVLSTGSTPHNMFASHVWESQHHSPSQLASLTRAIKDLTKYVQDQDARIVKITDRVKGMMDEESSHAPGKRPQVQEIVDLPSKQVKHAKEIQISSNGTIPINQIKEFIIWEPLKTRTRLLRNPP